MTDNTRTSSAALKVLNVLIALQGHCLNGLSNTDLAKALRESPTTINRCCNTLIAAGLVTQLENGRFAHSVKMLQIAQSTANELSRGSERIAELTQRINRF
ncbi:MAG: helix-turn-helix domain-containing protein [Venatoribacter sp.]